MNQGDLIKFGYCNAYGLLYTLNSTHVYYRLDECLSKFEIGHGFGSVNREIPNLILPVEVI